MYNHRTSARARLLRLVLTASVATALLAGCAANPSRPMTTGSVASVDFDGAPPERLAASLQQLSEAYKRKPDDKATMLYYSAALRANGQAEQAAAVLEAGIGRHRNDPEVMVAYAKSLASAGRFEQALNVVESAINPAAPDWNALLVKGAILDQSGRNADARAAYQTGLKIAPQQASLHANLGLSYAMTNDLDDAEASLRRAVSLRGANTKVRQNLALVVGLQGRFDEAEQLFAAELPPEQVASNMAYIRALLTQQNRWDLIKGAG